MLAVAAKGPTVVFALKLGEVAIPSLSLWAVTWLPPPAKVAPAGAVVALELLVGEAEPSVKLTVAPTTGSPLASSTRTERGSG
jgi:hypothetical protein